jgi:hypothetical protein
MSMMELKTMMERIDQALRTLSFESLLKDKREATRGLMEAFGRLGHEFGLRVSCHKSSYRDADNPEWMCDMVWWQANGDYMTSMPLALEAELNRTSKQGDSLDDDFAKLVQARAGIRVWISTALDAGRHIEVCKRQIELFDRSQAGDRYVFAVYDWNKRKLIVEQFAKP